MASSTGGMGVSFQAADHLPGGCGTVSKSNMIMVGAPEALEIQVTENIEKKKHRFIGTILVDQGYMKHSQISEVLKAMKMRS